MTAGFSFPDWLSLFFFSFFLVLAWLRPLEWSRRVHATALGVAGIALLALFPFRSILPLILIPIAYWQTGQFTAPVNKSVQRWLAEFDRRIFTAWRGISLPAWLRRGLMVYLECAYLLVYLMVPSGLAVLYFAGAIGHVSEFWTVILPPAYFCYATLPFLRTLPPRALEHGQEWNHLRSGVRSFNLVVVRLVTHEANTFPSGHAAAAVAVALEVARHEPSAGGVYLVLATSIVLGAFVARYHYAVDVLLGAALASISFLVS